MREIKTFSAHDLKHKKEMPMKSRNLDTNYKNLIVSLILYTLIAGFGAWRGFVMLYYLMPGLSAKLYIGGYLLVCTALPLGFFLPHNKISKALDIFGNYWLCFQLTFFFGSLVEWSVKLITVNLLAVLTKTQYAKVSMVIFFATAIATIYGIIHARVIHINRYDCPVRKPGIQGGNLTIVHLSDLHLGSINDYKAMKKVVEQVNTISPDLICITGDTFTENIKDIFEREEIEELFRSLKSKYGVFACLGNHDSGSDFSEMLKFFKNAGIQLLCEEGVELDGILLYGRTDMTPGGDLTHRRKAIEESLRDVEKNQVIIVMDHQPGDIENSQKAGVDLLLSGHTHGGQFFPVHRMVRRIFPHYFGCRQYEQMYSIISSGTCTAVPPIRIGSDSEIVVITVRGSGND